MFIMFLTQQGTGPKTLILKELCSLVFSCNQIMMTCELNQQGLGLNLDLIKVY